jgi:hypothetical protein
VTKAICAVDDCDKIAIARGWCARHYQSWKKYSDPVKSTLRQADFTCSADGCDSPAKTTGLCIKHYTRQLRNGDPLAVQYIRGDDRARFESYVDRSEGPDACHPWTGGQCTGGYGQISIKGALQLVHIAAWEFERGPKPLGTDIDHECHNQAIRDGACKPGICPHRLCCNAAHLISRTRREHADATECSYRTRGSRVNTAKVTETQVQEIRRLLAADVMPQIRIAELYDISPNAISRIKLGQTWTWLPPEP